MMPTLLSVIVPCYNVGPDITALLEKITSQLDSASELILVNDGSTDDTASLIGAYLDSKPSSQNIIVKNTVNQGAAKARALGLSCATGEFVFFCDSDDIFSDDFIDTFKRYHEDYPSAELLYFSSDIAIQSLKGLIRQGHKVKYEKLHLFKDGEALLKFNLSKQMYTAAVWTYIFKRSLVSSSGAAFTFRKAHEDHLFTLKIIVAAKSVTAIPEVLYTQRTRQGSLTNSHQDIDYVTDRITAAIEAENFLANTSPLNVMQYKQWNFVSITSLLRINRNLVPALLKEKTTWVYFKSHANLVWSRLLSKIKNVIRRYMRAVIPH